MNAKDAVVKRFWELCEKDNIKKNELARRAGISPSSVYSLFNDKRRDVSILTIKKLCDGLGISIKKFFDSDIFANLENELATKAGVTPSSVYSMFDETRRNVSIVLIKKLCDGLDMTLEEFFTSEIFNKLEQEIK